jgi:ClpX C4-type zinc finger
MVTFQITINGRPCFDSDDITALTLVAEELRRREGERISLHASGGDDSMQWLAANLKIGDEITVQIVDASEKLNSFPMACSFCGKDQHEVSNLVAGEKVLICGQCISDFSEALTIQKQLPIGAAIRNEPSWACGFCNNSPGIIPGVIVRNGAAICPECLRVGSDILSEQSGTKKEEA